MLVHGQYPLDSRVAREALAAVEAGWHVDVVAMQSPGEPVEEIIDGVSVIRLPLFHDWGARALAAIGEYIGFTLLATARVAALAMRRRYTVIHVHNPPDFLMVAALIPRALGARVILDVHDFAPELFATRFHGICARGAESLLRQIERTANRFATSIVTVHEPYRRALEIRDVPPHKITVVLNSLDEQLLPVSVPAAEDVFRIVYHGTITPHYGVELLVEAVAAVARDVPNLRLEIYGEGDALPSVRRRADDLGLSRIAYFSNCFLPQREVVARVSSASVGVVCNLPIERNESAVPTKLFEYACLGVPIVTSDLTAIREYFSPAEVRFFRGGDAADLASALLEVAIRPEDAGIRASAARHRYYKSYRWAFSARRYVELLDRLGSTH